MSFYSDPSNYRRNKIKDELHLSNYATKSEVKKALCYGTSEFSKKVDLAGLKYVVDKSDLDKLKIVPVDLSKLSNVVKNDVIKILHIMN